MRVVQLGKVAAQAEKLRIQSLIGRQVNRALYAAIAAVFALALLAALHVAAALAMTPSLGALWATLIVAAFDLVVAGALGGVALASKPGRIEREALMVREEARAQLGEATVMSMVVGPVMRRAGMSLMHRVLTRPRR